MHEKPLAAVTTSQLSLWEWILEGLTEGFTDLPLLLHQHMLGSDGAQKL